MRIGVVGCGYWGAKHVRVLQQIPAVSSVAVIDLRPERRTRSHILQAASWASRIWARPSHTSTRP